MRGSWMLPAWLAALTCALAGASALAAGSNAASTVGAAPAANRVAGTVETKMVINRFTAVGTHVVGRGTVTSTQRDAAGNVVATKQKSVNLGLKASAGPGPCQVLFLELDELDLQLLGLRVFLRSATAGEPVRLTLSADSTHGVLGKLFCDLASATIDTSKKTTATTTATALNKRLDRTAVFHATATLYTPNQTQGSTSTRKTQAVAANCPVLHVILGPLHLDLLGLIADLNKIALDIEAVPGTTVGDLFCGLVGGATTTSTPATTTATPTTSTPTTTAPTR
jgi:hypothetical protein